MWWVTEGPAVAGLPAAAQRSAGPRVAVYTLILGSKGQGKTTLARRLARARVQAGGLVAWIDPTAANGDLGPVCRDALELWRVLRDARAARRGVCAVLQPGWGANVGPTWELLYRIGCLLMVLDEAQLYASVSSIDPGLRDLVALGRNQRVDIVATARTGSEIHGTLKANRDVTVSFRQVDPYYARDTAERYFGSARWADVLLRLPRGAYLRSDGERLSVGRVTFPG